MPPFPHPEPDRDELDAFARRLAGMPPSTQGLNLDRMIFEAGRASACDALPGLVWRGATVLLVLVAFGLGGLLVRAERQRLLLEHQLVASLRERALEQADRMPPPMPGHVAEPIAPASYLALSRRIRTGELFDPPSAMGPSARVPTVSGHESPLSPLRVRNPEDVLDL